MARKVPLYSIELVFTIIILSILFVANSIQEVTDISTLRLVHVLYRHGDRSAITPYVGDPVKESDWPQGFGQLTKTGMEQEYQLGQFLRRRYIDSGFMNNEYKRSEIYVRSTTIDRALMSAYCVLTGVYPPDVTQSWNKKILWQPIPVHTVPENEDYLLLFNNCPNLGADELSPDVIKKKTQFMQNNKDLIIYIAQCTGVNATVDGFISTLDPIFCENLNGKNIPACIKNSTFDFLGKIVHYRNFAASLSVTPPKTIRLRGGTMVGKFLEQMQNKTLNVTNGNKLYMYSAHDTNVIALLRALNIFDDKQPPYSACVIIELHETPPGKFVVRVYHKNVTDSSKNVVLRKPVVPGCPSHSCPLQTFKEVVKYVIPSDPKKECGVGCQSQFTTKGYIMVAVLLLLVIIFTLILVSVLFHYRRKYRKLRYQRVPTDDL